MARVSRNVAKRLTQLAVKILVNHDNGNLADAINFTMDDYARQLERAMVTGRAPSKDKTTEPYVAFIEEVCEPPAMTSDVAAAINRFWERRKRLEAPKTHKKKRPVTRQKHR